MKELNDYFDNKISLRESLEPKVKPNINSKKVHKSMKLLN